MSNVRGKGLLALDGDSGLKDAGNTTLILAGNALDNPAVTADGYLEAEGSTGGLVGYKSSVFNAFEVEKPLTIYADDDWIGTTPGADPDGAGPATIFGYDAFATVQDGIDAVAEGGTVHVAAGTYEEDLSMPYPVNLIGDGMPVIQGEMTIDHSDYTGSVETLIEGIRFETLSDANHDNIVLKGVDGITIKGCEFDGAGKFMNDGARAVQMSSPTNNNVNIEGSTFRNGYYVTIQGRVTALTVKNSTMENVKSGINLQGGSDLVVEDTNISVIAQGVENDTYGIRFASSTGTAENMTVLGGSISVDKNGLNAKEGTYHSAIVLREAASGVLSVEHMAIDGEVVNLSSTTLDASPNWWGSAAGPAAGAVIGDVKVNPWCYNETCTELYVAEGGLIQDAIDAASDGDTIHVAAGTYDEGITQISKSLTIIGSGSSKPIITPTENTGTANEIGTTGRGWFQIHGGAIVTFENLEFDGTGKNIYTAVHYHEDSAGGSVIDCDFANIKHSQYQGRGINNYGTHVNVEDCTFSNIQRIGVFTFNPTASTNITGSDYTGKSDGDWLDYAVEIGNDATANIDGNTFTNCTGVALSDGSGSAAILVTYAYGPNPTATISNNIISDNTTGLHVGYDADDTSVVTATGNTFTGNEYHIVAKNETNINITDALANNTFVNAVVIEGEPVIYSTIQGAIDDADPGDVIEVSDGTYNYDSENEPVEKGLIKVSKPVTIKAAEDGNGERPVIDGTGMDGVFKIHHSTFTGGQVVIEG
ncbi:MAG: hypothetical protein SVP52_03210, partial [Chloroflexota bacterium]|nr:hypothetical protein [Chloroflexota bacterium]